MNKAVFIKELSTQTVYNEEKCVLINNFIENYFIFGRKKKAKIIHDLQIKVSLSEDNAEKVYDISMRIITEKIKNKESI